MLAEGGQQQQTATLLVRHEILDHNYKKSFQYSKRIQEAYPELYLGYELNGDAAAASGKLGDAAQQYALAWDRLPSEELAIKRANVASLNNNYTVAAGYLQEWLAGHPDAVRVQQFLGSTWQSMGKSALAIEQYEKVLQADPKNRVALNNIAVLYQTIDRVKAMQLAEQAWRLDPSDPGVQDTYGWLLVQHGQLERGRPLLDKAVAVLGNVPEVRYHHAVAVYRAGDREQGKALLQSLLSDQREFEGRAEAQRLLKDM
jgi:tetratricopeptide (TPR) repeat protein